MKKFISIICLIPLFHISFAEIPTIKSQLESLNKCWKYQLSEDQVLNVRKIISDDEVKFIQFHLTYVEQKLRTTNIDHLNDEQRKKRAEALKILNTYNLNGVFPKNLFHTNRTPYFIDHLGTACAVGYLIIKSGYEELAKKISMENNYGYISDLDIKYIELGAWADEHGFTIEELAWIQPAYTICDTLCDLQVSIGVSSGTPPYNFDWDPPVYVTQVMGNYQLIYDFCPDKLYTCTVTDANGIVVPAQNCTIVYEVPYMGTNTIQLNSYPVYLYTSKTDDDGTCSGTATAFPVGSPPHTYTWQRSVNGVWQTISASQMIINQCAGNYRVFTTNAYSCSTYDSVVIGSITGLEELSGDQFNIFPNPANDEITLSNINGENIVITIYNILGENVLFTNITSHLKENVINIEDLNPGIYSMRIYLDEKLYTKKFVKSN